ncbi:hypothetical protein F5X96DRAFT_481734 [Biscogniauxia mediterranea]|nr:hypothetical protein F5X96DRAFT_481734 [Biscogniauxia mediterranea]
MSPPFQKTAEEVEPPVPDSSGPDNAIDDTEYLADDLVTAQKNISDNRRQCKMHKGIHDILPVPFSPNIRPITLSDLESCIALENAAFPNPDHRCSREKFEYRLTVCPELSMGVFCTVVPSSASAKNFEIDTLRTAKAVETGRNDGAVSVLLSHIISTRSNMDVVTDDAMDYPRDYKTNRLKVSPLGHQEIGRTICIHSLAVDPKLQGCGMGKLILKAYLQQVKNSALADRVALICQDYLVNYYKRFGFGHVGPSKATFGGGGWHDMVIPPLSPNTQRLNDLIENFGTM